MMSLIGWLLFASSMVVLMGACMTVEQGIKVGLFMFLMTEIALIMISVGVYLMAGYRF